MKMIEGLETRRLLAPLVRVKSVVADNRGEVVITLSERAVGVKGAAAQLYTAGADGTLFTNDDVKQTVRFTYSENKKQIKLTAKLAKDTPYRVKLDGKTRIRSEADGQLLDGNYTSNGASGDGVAGGNYEAQFNRDRTSTPSVIQRTSVGDVPLRLRFDAAPVSAGAFLSIANKGDYDKIFITRSVTNFVVQTGSLQIGGDGQQAADIEENTASEFLQELPRQLSNERGTLSFARGGAQLTASNQFFYNLVDNNASNPSALNNLDVADDPSDAVFTPFAEVTSAAGLATIDAIAQKPSADLSSQIPAFSGATGRSSVPVNNVSQAQASLNPNRDLIIIYRTAAVMIASSK